MPIYEYICDSGHLEERYQTNFNPPKATVCPCGLESYLQVSLCTMKPDSHWNGTVLPNGKLVTNSKQYKAETANWQERTDATDAFAKQRKREKERERKEKIKKQVEAYVSTELSGVDI